MPPRTDIEAAPAKRPGRPKHSGGEVADVRERLLDAATELAVEQGFDACGLREIADRAAVSPGMISYYFGDRDGLYRAMFERVFARISEKVAAVMSDPDRSGGDRIEELVRIQVTSMASDPWLPILVMREVLAKNNSPMRAFFGEEVANGPLSMMVNWIEEEQARYEIRSDFDPRMLAMTIASMTSFPFLMLPLVGDRLGLQLDDEFPGRLIEHNQKILTYALRAQTENEQ
jgi:AcrR family transcriptional regulator